jgi:hypothetical protein
MMNQKQRVKMIEELGTTLSGWVDNHPEITLSGENTGFHMAVAAMTVLDAIQDVEEALIADGLLVPDDDD